jgi:glucose-6-phosphate isomerase
MEAHAELTTVSPARERPAWKALEAHYQTISKLHLRTLFADEPQAW